MAVANSATKSRTHTLKSATARQLTQLRDGERQHTCVDAEHGLQVQNGSCIIAGGPTGVHEREQAVKKRDMAVVQFARAASKLSQKHLPQGPYLVVRLQTAQKGEDQNHPSVGQL